jgi:hypothetical protein
MLLSVVGRSGRGASLIFLAAGRPGKIGAVPFGRQRAV